LLSPFDLSLLIFYHKLKAVYALIEAIRQTQLKYKKYFLHTIAALRYMMKMGALPVC